MRNLLLTSILALLLLSLQAQVKPIHPTDIVKGKYYGISKALRDIPPMTADEFHQLEMKGLKRTLNKDLKNRIFPFAATALPKGADPARQDFMGSTMGNRSPLLNFDGQTSPYYPPDCNGTAGPNHFMQTINTVYAIYDKTGTLVAGPTNMNLLFGSVPGANRNDGDPIILYDEQADRWVATEFSIPYSGANYMLMAVSTTNEPTGTWHQYSFQVASMPDYPKFSIWQDGYYMGDNNNGGNDIYVFERAQMLIGAPAQGIGFNNAWRPTSVDGFMCVPPIDNDGAFAPAGAPGMFIAFNDDALGGGTDQLWLYELTVDWTTPANSTFARSQQLDVQPFSSNFGNNWDNIEQKGTNQRLDGIPQVIMNVPQYRNFGSYQTIVCCHTVNVDGIRHAGIRWYELRKTAAAWEVRQQGTYAPDANSRWMGSICMNGSNEIGMGYSVSSTTINPGLLFCGQSAGANANATGILDLTEDTIQVGANSQTGANRWGDYAQISLDPTDDKTFWFTSQYIGGGGSRKTKIASFRYDFAPLVSTLPATSVAITSATLNGIVNPNGIQTDYHFEYGLTPISLTFSTPIVSAGAGSVNVDVSADIVGLSPATVYFYKTVGQSTGGTASGLKVKFTTPAAPFLAVTPPNQNVASMSGQTEFEVAANVDWTVVSDAAWCTVTTSGAGNDTIFAQFSENPIAASRIAQVTVSGSGVAPQIVTVTQEGAAPLLSVTPPNQNIPIAAGNTQFDVASNTTWTVVSDVAWCTVSSGGSLNGIITATYQENISIVPRIGNVTVTASGLPPVIVTVTQAAVAATLSVTPLNQNVPAIAGSSAFEVTSNINWSVQSDANWCTVTQSGSGNGTIVADYTQNTSDQPRKATITISNNGIPSYILSAEATITQAKSTIGMEEFTGNDIQIYPNPTHGLFKIVPANGFTGIIAVSVQDLTGKIILRRICKGEKDYQLDLSGVAPGTYNIILKTDLSVTVKKLVLLK
ncbi:MAG: BACON domain-containing carbohydrate-binding protein [Bacteroidetes bacterium]|nr:BACON domain-containing carbohydrate-binding protein [Bacteroidota bacterium]